MPFNPQGEFEGPHYRYNIRVSDGLIAVLGWPCISDMAAKLAANADLSYFRELKQGEDALSLDWEDKDSHLHCQIWLAFVEGVPAFVFDPEGSLNAKVPGYPDGIPARPGVIPPKGYILAEDPVVGRIWVNPEKVKTNTTPVSVLTEDQKQRIRGFYFTLKGV